MTPLTFRFILPFALLIAAPAHAGESTSPEMATKVKEKAQSALMPFKKQLKGTLQEGLKEGPAEAVASCNVEAPKIADRATTDDIRVGRTSHKLRNPSNAPKTWMKPLLDAYVKGDSPQQVVKLEGGGYGYVEPIMMQPMCLNCHGAKAQLDPKVKAKLNELYPKDEATGFAPDAFRGLFWVELAETAVR